MKITRSKLKQIIREEIEVIKEGSYSLSTHWAQFATEQNISQPWENEFLDANWTAEERDYINDVLEQAYVQIHDKLYEENDELQEQENNPWAICTDSVGRDDKEKYEKCVKSVKRQNRDKK